MYICQMQFVWNFLLIYSKHMWFYNLRVASCELRFSSCNFKKIKLRVVSSFLRVANLFHGFEIKLRVLSCFFSSCEFLFKSSKLKKIILRVSSCILWVENNFTIWKKYFAIDQLLFTSWTFKMSIWQITITCMNQI